MLGCCIAAEEPDLLEVYPICATSCPPSSSLLLSSHFSSEFTLYWNRAVYVLRQLLLLSLPVSQFYVLLFYTSGNILLDFYNGREIRPMALGLDLKLLLYYPAAIGASILQAAFALRQYEKNGFLTLGVATILFIKAILLFDFVFFEPTLIYAHDVLYDGFGIRWLQSVLLFWPLINSLGLFHLAQANRDVYPFLEDLPELTLPFLGVLISCLGLFIRRRAIIEKFRFRSERLRTKSSGSGPTSSFASKGVLASGWWGLVRHPDYLGDVILSLGLAIPAGFASATPWIAPMCVFVATLCRIRWAENACKKKYDKAVWKDYIATVPHRLIPGIY